MVRIVLPAMQAADTQVMAEYARRLSDLVMRHNCNLVCAYEWQDGMLQRC